MKKVYGASQLRALFDDPLFVADLGTDRLPKDDAKMRADALIYKYKIWSWFRPVIEYLLMTGDVKIDLANEPVNLRKDHFSHPLSLVLAPDITQPILREYITDNWKEIIKPNINGIPRGRETRPSFPERDENIYQDYLNRNKLGLTITGIALKYSVSSRTVSRIVSDKKKSF